MNEIPYVQIVVNQIEKYPIQWSHLNLKWYKFIFLHYKICLNISMHINVKMIYYSCGFCAFSVMINHPLAFRILFLDLMHTGEVYSIQHYVITYAQKQQE
jgi:hypothetical protein